MTSPLSQHTDSIRASLDAIDTQANQMQAAADALQSQVNAQRQTIADRDAEIARLKQPATPPPATRKVRFGWNTGGWWNAGQNPTDAYSQAKLAFGGKPGVIRLWPNKVSTSWTSLIASFVEPDVPVFINLGSDVAGANAGSYDATLAALCKSAPTTRAIWLSFAHEPENDGFTMADWQKAQARLAKIKADNAPKNVRWVPLLMGTTFMPTRYSVSASGNRPAVEWFSFDLTNVDALGADIYQWGKADATGDPASLVVQPCIDLARTKGKGLVVGELGARNLLTDDGRAKFLTDAVALFKKNADVVEAVCYFENDNGALGPWNLLPRPGTTTPDLPKSIAVWKSAVQS